MERIVDPRTYIGTVEERDAADGFSPGDIWQIKNATTKEITGITQWDGTDWLTFKVVS